MRLSDVRFDCRYYSGYKPCANQTRCGECREYSAFGEKILIIKFGAMGDVLRTTTILEPLAQQHPDAQITWVTLPESIPLLRHNPLIHRLFSASRHELFGLAGEEFDLLISLDKEYLPLSLAHRVQAKRKLGFAPTRFGGVDIFNPESEYALRMGLSDDLKFRENRKTHPQILFEMLGLEYRRQEYILELGADSRAFAESFRRKHGLEGNVVVGIHTGCGEAFETKQWTRRGFCELIKSLSGDAGAAILLMGGRREQDFNASILAEVAPCVIDAGCENSLEGFLGLVSLCDVVIASDSLAMHVAIGLKKQVVAIFGPTASHEIELYGRGAALHAEKPCAPCYRKTCDERPTCMEMISPERVFEAVRRILENPGKTSPA